MQKIAIPAAIIIAGIIIGIAVVMTSGSTTPNSDANANTQNATIDIASYDTSEFTTLIEEVGVEGDLLGSSEAAITLVEYSDTECPFCKRHHSTMKQLMREYGPDGDLAWQYQHFPIAQLHAKATREAEALECIREVGGSRPFWTAIDTLYEVTPGNDGFNLDKLPDLAEHAGVDVDAFNTCVKNGETKQLVQDEISEARSEGASGTPYSVIKLTTPASNNAQDFISQINEQYGSRGDVMTLSENATQISMSGAIPHPVLDQLFKLILGESTDSAPQV